MYQKLENVLHVVIWLSVVLIHAWIFSQFMRFEVSLLRAISNVIPMAAIFYFNFWLVNKFINKRKFVRFVLLIVLVFVLATFIRTEINTYFPDIREELSVINERQGWFLGAVFTNLSVLVISTFYQMLYNRYRAEKRNLAIINEQREAQLQALRAQINPHFLFNTLNNIYSLAVIKSDKTAEMVLKLSNLLRYVIYDGRSEKVSLEREVEQIGQFIELFQMRSEEPVDIRFKKQGLRKDQKLEPMILIPIVENCFKHCDFDTNPGAFIDIDLQVKNDELFFYTTNTKNDDDQQKDQFGGVGLDNIKKRLSLKYPGRYLLEVKDADQQFFVKLKLKLSNESD